MWILILLLKGYIFNFCPNVLGLNFILTPRSMILRGVSEKFEYLSEDETKNKNILSHWSVAQAGSNDEKTGGR